MWASHAFYFDFLKPFIWFVSLIYAAAGILQFAHCGIIKTNSTWIQIQLDKNRCHGSNTAASDSLGFHTHTHTHGDEQFQSVEGMKPAEQVLLIVADLKITRSASIEFLWLQLSFTTHETPASPHEHMLYNIRCAPRSNTQLPRGHTHT